MLAVFRNIALLLLLLCCCTYGSAQKIVDYQHKTIVDGLADRLVHHVMRDSLGYFYLATDVGIQRYDGKNFDEVSTAALAKANIKPAEIKRLYRYRGDVVLRTKANDRYFLISAGALNVEEVKLPITAEVLVGGERLYLAVPAEKGTAIYDLSEQSRSPSMLFDLPDIPAVIDHGVLGYFASIEDTLYQVDQENLQRLPYSGVPLSIGDHTYVVNDRGVNLLHSDLSLQKIYSIDSMELKLLREDRKGRLIACYGATPRYINDIAIVEGDSVVLKGDNIFAQSNKFLDIYADDYLAKMMTVGYEGIKVFNLLQPGFKHHFDRKLENEIFGNIVSGIAAVPDGRVFFLKESRGLRYLSVGDQDTVRWRGPKVIDGIEPHHFNNKMYYHGGTNSLYSNSYTYNNLSYIYQVSLDGSPLKRYDIPFKLNDFLVLDNGKILVSGYLLRDGDRYLATRHAGVLGEYDIATGELKTVFTREHNLYSLQYRKQSKEYWLGSREGLYVLDEDYNLKFTFDRYQSEPRKIEEDRIRITADYGPYVVVGTIGGGVYVIDPDRYAVIAHLDRSNGLSDNKAVAFLEDDQGLLWVGTWNGLNVVNSDLKVVRQFFEQHGLRDKEFNTKAMAKDHHGQLYFGSVNGILEVDPEVALNMPLSHGLHLLPPQIHHGKTVHNINGLEGKIRGDSISIAVAMPDYIQYPFGKGEISLEQAGDQVLSDVHYSDGKIHLQPVHLGKGELRVSSPNTSNSRIMPVVVQKDWMPYLKALLALLVLIAIPYIIIKRNQRLEAEKTAINKQIAGLELAALRSQMNPHFIFNALGAIQYFIQTQNVEKADEYLSDFAMLMRKILESSKAKFITLGNEIQLLELYIGLEKVRFEDRFDYRIEVEPGIDREMAIPPMILQPFIENAINHGLHHLTSRKGDLLLEISRVEQSKVLVRVVDNGIGRKEAAKHRNKKHKSRGMQIVRERIETFNRTDQYQVEVEVIDRLDDQGKICGTEARLLFEDKH